MDNLNYGIIGNCRSAALISETGNIEWLCLPDFDSPSVFASLLDREKGGGFGFEVSEDYRISQSYIPQTNILSTRFYSQEGEFVVLDFMPCYRSDYNEHYLPPEVYRYIRYISGQPRFRVDYDPAPNYARGKVVHSLTPHYLATYSSGSSRQKQYLYSSLPLQEVVVDKKEVVLSQDEFFLLSSNEKVIPVDMEQEKREYCRTMVYWQNWTTRAKRYTRYNDIILRSLLVLKLMSYHNGAVLAALTTSLPEVVGEVRNWDYRFCWLRDASMSIETLFRVGHVGSARRFMKFIQKTFISRHRPFQIMYGIRGEQRLTETTLDHLSGYKGSKPVRVGNAAYQQKQNDSFGYLMDLIYQYYHLMPGTLDEIEEMWGIVKSILATVIADWRKPDKGIWEIRGEARHFVSSKVMCWVALDRGARIATKLKKHDRAGHWRREADLIRQEVFAKGWKEEIQSFSQTYDSLSLDSSLLLMEPYGFIDAGDIRYQKTVKAVREALFHKGLMFRYNSRDDFGMPTSAFTICSFWLVRALFAVGQREEARSLFDEILTYSNHLGLFSEDIDFDTKEQLGNFPQAYSHLSLVNTAILFAEEEERVSFIRP